MKTETLIAVGVGLAFFFAGRKSSAADSLSGDSSSGGTTTDQGGGPVPCAPGLVRGQDGKCRKRVKAKPGTKVDPDSISDTRPDVIDRDDAWIAPGCSDIMYGPDFFRETIVPVVLEYVDAGYGFAPEFNPEFPVAIPAVDRGAVLSIGQMSVIAGLLGTYRPECADLLIDFVDQNFPSTAEMQAYEAEYGAARSAFVDSQTFENDFEGDPGLRARLDEVIAKNPYVAYYDSLEKYIDDLPNVSGKVKDLIRALRLVIETRGYKNREESLGGTFDLQPYIVRFPARFTVSAEDFA